MDLLENEVAKPIPNYEEYFITTFGRVWSTKTNRWLKQNPRTKTEKCPYLSVALSKNNQAKRFSVHRLVAENFIPNPNNLPVVNHKDENKLNNNVDNLEWCTEEYNNNYGTSIQKRHLSRGQKIAMCDIETKEVIKEFESMKQASEETHTNYTSISFVCHGKQKSAGGYYWKFI